MEKRYFCQREDGSDFVAAVWPGDTHFPDVLNKDARKWFGDKYSFLIDQGIEGFWNDMNEPAIFYTEDHLKEVFEKIHEYENQNLDINTFFAHNITFVFIKVKYIDKIRFAVILSHKAADNGGCHISCTYKTDFLHYNTPFHYIIAKKSEMIYKPKLGLLTQV